MPDKIIIRGARVHNLKNVNLEIPHNKLVVFTGLSGSGKSSLAFDTIFAEGQRRYIESLSPYARQFLGQMKPADVDEIVGLAPSIAIDQKALSHNPRSTVGTLTEIYDYLRVLYARVGEVFCPQCGRKIKKLALDEMVDIVNDKMKELAIRAATILAPVVIDRKGEYYQLLYDYLALGYGEARIDGEVHSLHEQIKLARYKKHNIDIVIDKVMPDDLSRLAEAIEASLQHSNGLVVVVLGDGQDQQEMLLSANWTCPYDNFAFPEVEPRLFSFNSPHGACPQCSGLGRLESWEKKKIAAKDGEMGEVANRYERVTKPCLACAGQRLRPETLAIKILDKNIAQISALAIDKLYDFFEDYRKKISKRNQEIAGDIIQEVSDRLFFAAGRFELFVAGPRSRDIIGRRGPAHQAVLANRLASVAYALYS